MLGAQAVHSCTNSPSLELCRHIRSAHRKEIMWHFNLPRLLYSLCTHSKIKWREKAWTDALLQMNGYNHKMLENAKARFQQQRVIYLLTPYISESLFKKKCKQYFGHLNYEARNWKLSLCGWVNVLESVKPARSAYDYCQCDLHASSAFPSLAAEKQRLPRPERPPPTV